MRGRSPERPAAAFRKVNVMKTLIPAILALLLAMTSPAAFAIDIDEAKAQGLVGETMTGYIAAVKVPPSAEVRALIDEVNTKRKAAFERTASRTNTTLVQVSHRFYELAVERTKAGHYYQDAGGRWVRK